MSSRRSGADRRRAAWPLRLDVLLPSSAAALQPLALVISGTGFLPSAVVRVGAVDVTPTSVTPTSISASVLGAVLDTVGPVSVRVVQGTVTSNALTLTVGA